MVLDIKETTATEQVEERELLDLAAGKMLQVLPRMFKQMMSQCKDAMPLELSEVGEAQFRLIHMLGHREYTISDLARRMHVTAPTVSRMVDSLVGRGLIDRRPDRGDRRIIWLSLTTKGQEANDQVARVFRTGVAQLMNSLSDEQLQLVISAMDVLQNLVPESLRDNSGESV